jgi:hypothetical protein
MSASYECSVEIEGYEFWREEQIRPAINDLGWDETEWEVYQSDPIVATFRGTRSVSHTPEEELAQEINDVIVKANGASCIVRVNLLCLDYLPWESFEFGVKEDA